MLAGEFVFTFDCAVAAAAAAVRLVKQALRAVRTKLAGALMRFAHTQEDEMTLIIVGAVLGGLAGYGQTFFY